MPFIHTAFVHVLRFYVSDIRKLRVTAVEGLGMLAANVWYSVYLFNNTSLF